MFGQMQDSPLLVSQLIEHAATLYPEQIIASKTAEGHWHEYNYKEAALRSRKLAQALIRLGIKDGDVIATMAWNTHRHFECWYGISGMGAILHTVNPRLFPEQLEYIINHAQDQYIFIDASFAPLLEKLQLLLPNVKGYILMTDAERMPETSLKNALCYETLIEQENGDFTWPVLDERQATSICYTSGTTGNPKGVLYSHRSSILHSWAITAKSVASIDNETSLLPIVPMFHANAWGLVYASAMTGAKLILPGPHLDGKSVCQMVNKYEVDLTAAVPTVWTMLLQYLEESGETLKSLNSVLIGGSAVPRSMIEKFETVYGVEVWQAWGMTEMSPLGSLNRLNKQEKKLDYQQQLDIKVKQGRPCFGVQMKIVDDNNAPLPHDGIAFGRLMVKGPWVVASYFRSDKVALEDDGWFDTGDVANIDASGNMQITDRSKDVIKSGGEWISSIDLENAAMGHPDIAEAAVIGVAHPKWEERPLLIVVPKDATNPPSTEQVLEFLSDKVAKWWLPDDMAIVTEIPHTATGKINKLGLRQQFKEYQLPVAQNA
jgi:acyl-CoA synthetase (AMP-forming)/AMP-acid ligase II